MIQAGILNVLVTASTGQATAALRKSQAQFRATAATAESSAAKTRSAWMGVIGGLGLVGLASIKLSSQFNQSMQLIETQANAPKGEIAKLRGEVLKLAKASEFSPDQLAQGLFHVESVGIRGAKAIHTLNAAQKLASVGQSDLESTTYALVSALETGIRGTGTLGKTIGTLNSIVGTGDMRMEDLTGALSTGILPAAKSVGLGLRDVGSALDLMTARGTPAQAAATRLRMTFALMAAPTSQAKDELSSIGIGATDLAKKMRSKDGLPGAIQLLHDKLQSVSKVQANQIITKAFGGGRSSSAIMAMVQNVDDLHKRFDAVGKGAKNFGRDFAEQQQTTSHKFKAAWSTIEADLIAVGDKLAGPVADGVSFVASHIDGVFNAIATLPPEFKTMAMAGIAAAGGLLIFGRVLVPLWGMVTAAQAAIVTYGALAAEEGVLTTATVALSIAFEANPFGVVVAGAVALTGVVVGLVHLFSGGGGLHGIQKRLAQSSDRLSKAWDGQKDASKNLQDASKRVEDAHHRAKRASDSVRKAEKRLDDARSQYGKHSLPVLRAEAALARAKNRDSKATKHLQHMEKLEGNEKKAAKVTYKDVTAAAVERIITLKDEKKQLSKKLAVDIRVFKATGQGIDNIKDDQSKLGENTKNLDDAHKKLTTTFGKSSQEISKKFSASLKDASQKLLSSGGASRKVAALLQDPYGTALAQNIQDQQRVGKLAYGLGRGVPKDYNTMATGSSRGLGRLSDETQHALDALGVRKHVSFGLSRQRGGMIPGIGDGDKVPVMAEPGEGFINKRAVQALGGPGAIHAINNKWQRFKRGGVAGKGSMGAMVSEVNRFESQHFPYLWGGGHGGFGIEPVDCSGFVSDVLHAGGLLQGAPMTSGSLMNWGKPGKGPLTVYASPHHTVMSLNGKFAGTSGSNPGGGAGWIEGGSSGLVPGGVARTMDAVAQEIKRVMLGGPSGDIHSTGQGALDDVRKAADGFIRRSMPAGSIGGGDAQVPGGPRFRGSGSFLSSAYGPPWGGIQGTGVTATGVNLSAGQKAYGVAVDPSVIGLGSNLKISPNPFGYRGGFSAFDTGGAIKGNRIDFYDWLGRADQNAWGMRNVNVKGFAKGGVIGRAEHIGSRLGHEQYIAERIRERINIAEQKAGLVTSPMAEELSQGEINRQIKLQKQLLSTLREERQTGTKGRGITERLIHDLTHGKDFREQNLKKKIGVLVGDRHGKMQGLQSKRDDLIADEKKRHPKNPNIDKVTKDVDKAIKQLQKKSAADIKHYKNLLANRKKHLGSVLTEAHTLHTTFASDVRTVAGLTGRGGTIFDTRMAIKGLRSTSPGGGVASTGLSISQLMDFARAMRYGAFESDLPAFHQGGVVRPPGGKREMAALLSDGEGVLDAETMRNGLSRNSGVVVEIEIASGMEWLKEFIDARVAKGGKKAHVVFKSGAVR